MRNRETKVSGFERSIVETISGEDTWHALKEFADEKASGLKPLEVEVLKRRASAARRIAYWSKRIEGVISKVDEERNFEFWRMRNGVEKEDWRRQREMEVRRISKFFEWADGNDHNDFPPPSVFSDGGYDHLLARWLVDYRELEKTLASGKTKRAAALAFSLGEMSERFRWRFGKDGDTGKRIESLALGKRSSEGRLPAARKRRHDPGYKPDWESEAWQLAVEIWKKNPSLRSSASATARLVSEKMERPKPKWDTIRKKLKKMMQAP